MGKYSAAKQLVLEYQKAMEQADSMQVEQVLAKFMASDYDFKSSYPNRNLKGITETAAKFWSPLKSALTDMQRRMDIFIAGTNEFNDEIWVLSMGHFMGLFDREFLNMRPTNKMISLRYNEFSCVKDGKIIKTGLFVDYLGMMKQAGCYPLPPSTAQYFVYPGPRTHDGLLFEDAPEEEGVKTLAVVNEMVEILDKINRSGSMRPPTEEELGMSWDRDMIWYGPAGIGATYTIPRYIEQHTGPFRSGLGDKKFVGHEVRFAEGKFACFFGWPNLTNRNIGGFLGLPSGNVEAEMQVVDVYCRQNDKLSENWVTIDIPWWLKQQGLDIFERTASILNKK